MSTSNSTTETFACTVCKRILPFTAEFFALRKGARKGLRHLCRDCKNSQSRELGKRKREARRAELEKIIPRGFKKCHRCEKILPKTAEYFYQRKTGYFSYLCKECSREKARLDYAINPEKRARMAAYTHNRYKRTYIPKPKHLKTQAQKRETKRHAEQRRRATQIGLPATFTDEDWTKALAYFGGRCAICDRPPGLWHLLAQEHWVAQSRGGAYTPGNILPICHGVNGCNNSKWNHDPLEWLEWKFGKRKAGRIADRIFRYFAWIKEQSDSA